MQVLPGGQKAIFLWEKEHFNLTLSTLSTLAGLLLFIFWSANQQGQHMTGDCYIFIKVRPMPHWFTSSAVLSRLVRITAYWVLTCTLNRIIPGLLFRTQPWVTSGQTIEWLWIMLSSFLFCKQTPVIYLWWSLTFSAPGCRGVTQFHIALRGCWVVIRKSTLILHEARAPPKLYPCNRKPKHWTSFQRSVYRWTSQVIDFSFAAWLVRQSIHFNWGYCRYCTSWCN